MSAYVPTKGDRVRVVLEGKVSATYSTGFHLVGDGGSYNAIDRTSTATLSVEKITPPLPTTVHSVIECSHNKDRYSLRPDGLWWNDFDESMTVDGLAKLDHDHLIIFDAGAER